MASMEKPIRLKCGVRCDSCGVEAAILTTFSYNYKTFRCSRAEFYSLVDNDPDGLWELVKKSLACKCKFCEQGFQRPVLYLDMMYVDLD